MLTQASARERITAALGEQDELIPSAAALRKMEPMFAGLPTSTRTAVRRLEADVAAESFPAVEPRLENRPKPEVSADRMPALARRKIRKKPSVLWRYQNKSFPE